MSRREDIHIKLLRIITGQVRSYINDHPEHVASFAIHTMPGSIAKRVAGELLAKGVVFDDATISHIREVKRRNNIRGASH